MVGRVVSTKMQHSAAVRVESKKTHPLYKKSFVSSKKYLADDPFGVSDGDVVIIEKVKPISRRKHWLITKVLGKDIVSLQEAELKEEAQEAIAEVLPEEKEEEPSEPEAEKKEPKTRRKASKEASERVSN